MPPFPLGGPHWNTAITFGMKKLEMVWLPGGKKMLRIHSAVSIEYRHVMDGWTDGWTSCDNTVRSVHTCRMVKTSKNDHQHRLKFCSLTLTTETNF